MSLTSLFNFNYLKEKYELVVLTNFFKDVQLLRMENVGLPFMFDDVIGGGHIY